MKGITLEIRAAEGGQDSKLISEDMAAMYVKAAEKNNFSVEINHWREGFVSLWIKGKGCKKYFQNEAGGHRWQRVPPTERRGRVHTSSVTVAVLEKDDYKEVDIYESELKIEYTKDSGPGGQHRNKTESCVVMTHLSTGIKVKEAGKDQHKNKREAYKKIKTKVNNFYRTGKIEEEVEERREQIGTGLRGDKKRTYRVKDDMVIDHETGSSCSFKKFMKGNLELLF